MKRLAAVCALLVECGKDVEYGYLKPAHNSPPRINEWRMANGEWRMANEIVELKKQVAKVTALEDQITQFEVTLEQDIKNCRTAIAIDALQERC